jgi:hypothetical protein
LTEVVEMSSLKQNDVTSPEAPARNVWLVAAWVLGAIGVVFIGLTFAFKGPNPDVAEWVYLIGFFVVFLALVAQVVGSLRRRGERVTVLPTTGVGWAVLATLAVAVALQFVEVVEGGFLFAVVAAIASIWATRVGRERSIVAIALPLLAAAFVVAFIFGELAIGHG